MVHLHSMSAGTCSLCVQRTCVMPLVMVPASMHWRGMVHLCSVADATKVSVVHLDHFVFENALLPVPWYVAIAHRA